MKKNNVHFKPTSTKARSPIAPGFSLRFACGMVLAGCSLLGGFAWGAGTANSEASTDAFAALSSNSIASRTVTLSQLGVRDVTLGGSATARREFYLPVPVGIPLTDATLQMDASYLRGDGGRTSVVVSLDGSPVLAHGFTQALGDASASVGVDGTARNNGFLRVGVDWSSVINDNACTDQTAIGNVLRIAPTSRLSYRFDSALVTDLRTAWSALPQLPVVMVAGTALNANAYDTAWRASALMQRDGKTPQTQRLPQLGDVVMLNNVTVPPALRIFPAFAALAVTGPHKLANPAEVAALIGLAPRPGFAPDLLVMDDASRTTLDTAVAALRNQVSGIAPGAVAGFDTWRKRFMDPLTTPLAAGEVRLAHLGAQDIVVVGDRAGIAVLAQTWRPIDVSNRLIVHQIDTVVQADTDTIALSDLGGQPGTVDVVDQALWEANFDLGATSGNNRLPDQVVLDLAAAPSPNGGAPIASVYFNDVLIGAKLLKTNGLPQHLIAHIPRYSLAARNNLRVVLQRQPDAAGCTTRSRGYPVAVLPTSHLVLDDVKPDDDFTGMNARFTSHSSLLIPQAYLNDPVNTVSRVARLADAAGMSPLHAVLTVVPDQTSAKPDGTFLAVDVKLDDEQARVGASQDRLKLQDASGRTLLDLSGLSNLAVIDVAHSGQYAGVEYHSIGDTAPLLPSFRLSGGDIAVVDNTGIVKQIDTLHPKGVLEDEGSYSLRQTLSWAIPAALVVLFIILLLAAAWTRRKHQSKT